MKHGICRTCAKRGVCTFPTAFQNVSQCDEYEGESRALASGEQAHGTIIAFEPLPQDASLCLTCSVKATCTYPHSEATVLECADYC